MQVFEKDDIKDNINTNLDFDEFDTFYEFINKIRVVK